MRSPPNNWGRALAESARRPFDGPATFRTWRWLWLSWLCWSPRHTLETTRGWSRCCRAPLWPSAAPRGPASPEQNSPSALAHKGCEICAGDDASQSHRSRHRWWWKRWRLCPLPWRPQWWQWFRIWLEPGFGLCLQSSRWTYSTQKLGTGPFWLLKGFVHHSGRNT